MKRILLGVLFGLSMTALVSAHPNAPRWGWYGAFPSAPQAPAETVTVTGNLTIVQGGLAVQNGGVTYHVYGLNRFIGFIDSLKEGAQVTIEGSAITSPRDNNAKYLRATKLSINGKDYDLVRPADMTGPLGPARRDGWR
ncbi:MAG: hypothetical protein LBG87_07480 [Spirochaetaceae bacterium]|jgi:hypothetical protein|nr:hypothetical protein [Spirochaetaceae bacterium]